MGMGAINSTGGASACGGSSAATAGLTYNSRECDLDTGFGPGWSDVDELPTLLIARNTVAARFGAENLIWFDDQNDGTYQARYSSKQTLVHDTGNHLFILTQPDGTIYEYFDADQTAHTPGSFYRSVAPSGDTIVVTGWTGAAGSDKIAEVQDRTSPTGSAYQKRVFTYEAIEVDEGIYEDRVETITLYEDNVEVRKITYGYYEYGDGDSNGLPLDLKTILTEQWDASTSSWADGDTNYFRYYTEDDAENGAIEHGLKRVLLASAYAAAEAFATTQSTTVEGLTEEQIDNYTCFKYEYDADGRVTKRVVFGESSGTTHANTMSTNGRGYNTWSRKAVETQLDGVTETIYTNFLGETLLSDLYDPDADVHTLKFNRFDDAGRLVLSVDTSGFELSGGNYYDELLPDLIGYNSGGSDYLSDTEGLFNQISYYTNSGGGAAEGYIHQTAVAEGEDMSRLAFGTTGGPIVLVSCEYDSQTVGDETIYVIDKLTTYAGEDETGAATTEIAYTWYNESFQFQQVTTTLPAVTVAQNGSGTGATTKQWYDDHGKLTWSMDELGRVAYSEYDSLTGRLTCIIEDVDSDLSSGLTPPSGYEGNSDGLHLTSDYEYDAFDRLTQTLGPEHTADVSDTPTNVRTATWTFYNDADHETRSAQGYLNVGTSAEVIVGPVSITITDLDGRTTEQIQAEYTGSVAGLAAATIDQEDYTAWTAYKYQKTRLVGTAVYDDIPASTSDPDVDGFIGTDGVNYEQTSYGYENYEDYGESDRMGRQNCTVAPDGTITRVVPDALGNVVETWVGTDATDATDDDPTGGSAAGNDMVILAAYDYDADGSLTESRSYFDDGVNDYYATAYQYDWRERLTDILSPADVVTHYDYDNLGRATWTKTYASADFTLSASELRAQTENLYDVLGRVYETHVYEVDPDDGTVGAYLTSEIWYDARGSVEQTTDPLGEATTYDYDGLGRQVKVTQPDPDGGGAGLAPWTVYAYDDADNLTSTTDRLSHSTSYTYDAIGRTVAQTDANSDTTEYAYDAAGHMASLTDAEGNATAWLYDDLGRVLQETNELSYTHYFQYDAGGNLEEETDRNGRVTEYVYDFLGRVTDELWKDGQTTVRQCTYSYDLLGKLLTASDPDAGYVYTYDAAGRLDEETQTLDGLTPTVVFTYGYDDVSRLEQVATTIGGTADAVTDYVYDNLGRLASIRQQDDGGNDVAEKRVDYTYDDAGQWAAISRYADLAATDLVATGTYGYDLTGRLTDLTYAKTGATLPDYDWVFDAANRITQYDNSIDGTVDYTNDDAGQLTGADYDYQTDEAYTYDDNGNRITANGDTYATGDNNQLTSDDTYAYDYDEEGNRTLRYVDTDTSGTLNSGDTDITEYEWDYRNRLVEVEHFTTYANYDSNTSDQIVTYAYDYQNRLVRKVLDDDGDGTTDSSTVFVHDGGQIALQFDKTGTGDVAAGDLSHRYLWGQAVDQILADETVDDGGAEDVLWALTDHLNTVRDLASYNAGTDETTIANHRVYDAFGNLKSETNSAVDCVFSYTGRLFDEDTGLQNNLHRWYDAKVGRWLSEDPIGFETGDSNIYRYVANMPVLLTDPSGLRAAGEGGFDDIQCKMESDHRNRLSMKALTDCVTGTLWFGGAAAVTCTVVGILGTPAAGVICAAGGVVIELALASPCWRAFEEAKDMEAELVALCARRNC